MDDLGLWCNYAQTLPRHRPLPRQRPAPKRVLPADEYAAIDWEGFKNNDRPSPPTPGQDRDRSRRSRRTTRHRLYLAPPSCDASVGTIAGVRANTLKSTLINVPRLARAPRPSSASARWACCVQHGVQPRRHDPLRRELPGLRPALRAEAADRRAEVWGGAERHRSRTRTTPPMNDHKANFAWRSHRHRRAATTPLTLCNWVWPMTMSPTKARDYRGDLDLEATVQGRHRRRRDDGKTLYKMVRGNHHATCDANTARGMVGCRRANGYHQRLRNVHDVVTEWPFTMDPDIEVFTEGTNKMDKEDFQTALTMM
ncbi:MAG: hypothetical protein ACLTDR_09770 [Adlercreutzia equolifaciens]